MKRQSIYLVIIILLFFAAQKIFAETNITVRSANGPENTVIMGAPDPVTGGLGTNAVTGVYMSRVSFQVLLFLMGIQWPRGIAMTKAVEE